MIQNKKILYLYTGNHPLHLAFAKTITNHVLPLSKKIPKNYDIYFVEGDYAKIVSLKKIGKLKKNVKIIMLFSDPRLFYLTSKKEYNAKKNKVIKTSTLKKIIAKKMLNEIDGVICVGKFEADIFRKLNKSVPIEPVEPFIEDELHKKCLKVKPKLNNKKILFIANGPDFYYKGIDVLIESFKKIKKIIPDSELHIIGKWDVKKAWKIPGVYFEGFKDNLLKEQYSKNSLYLHLARGEAFGLVVIESLLIGVPAIVSDLTGAKETVEQINKKFVVPLEVNKIVNTVKNYFDLSLEEKQKISKKSKQIASKYLKNYSLRNFKSKFEILLKKIYKETEDKKKKILFLRYEHIGDYGMALPVLKALREKFPKAQIEVAVAPWNKEFAEATPYVDKTIVFENPLAKRNLKYGEIIKIILSKKLLKILKFIKKVNKEKYDLVISLSDRKFTKPFLSLIRSKEKIDGTKIVNTGFDERKRLKQVMAMHNVNVEQDSVVLNYLAKDRKIVDQILKKDSKFKKKIVVHPITPLKEKNWPIKKWKSLLKRYEKKNYRFYLVGTKDQKKDLDKIKGNLENVENLAGKLSIIQTIYLMGKTNLVLGGDSGPVHLAELTKTLIISLFGPTNEKMWGTPGKKGKVLKEENIENLVVSRVFSEINKIIK